jgi:hypothetical protein
MKNIVMGIIFVYLLTFSAQAQEKGPFFPSRATTETGWLKKSRGKVLNSDSFSDPETCKKCHEDQYNQWAGSMHSNAWIDPLFQAAYQMASKDTDGVTDKFCAGCHSPIGVVSGEIPPADGSKLSEIGKKGIQCGFCHTLSGTTGIGNGAYVSSPGGGWVGGPFSDAVENSAHENEFSELFTKSELCGACHSVTNPLNNMPIERTYEEWRDSPYNTGDPKTTVHCQHCHMSQRPGMPGTGAVPIVLNPGKAATMGEVPTRKHIFTHYFVGGNAAVPGLLGSDTHSKLAVERLQNSARVEIEAPEKVSPGELAVVKVTVFNSGAGHKLPTGFPEGRQIWLDVTATDASGDTIYSSGALDKGNNVDPEAKIYRVEFVDKDGKHTLKLWFATTIVNDNRILPKGHDETRYFLQIPKDVKGPITFQAKLRYQSAAQDVANFLLGPNAPKIPAIDMEDEKVTINVGS